MSPFPPRALAATQACAAIGATPESAVLSGYVLAQRRGHGEGQSDGRGYTISHCRLRSTAVQDGNGARQSASSRHTTVHCPDTQTPDWQSVSREHVSPKRAVPTGTGRQRKHPTADPRTSWRRGTPDPPGNPPGDEEREEDSQPPPTAHVHSTLPVRPCADTDLQAWEPGADPTLGVQHSRAHGANYEPPSSTAPSGTVTSKLGSCTLSPYCSPAKSNRFQSPACDSIAIRRITPRVSGARLT